MLASTSVRRVAEALDLPRSTVQKILRNILRYYPYKLQFVQELLPYDFETRHLFSLQFLARLEVDPEWPWNILWTDEVHFHLDDLQARQCLSRIIFMQDGALPHIARCVKDVLKHHLTEERVISSQFRHLWPLRSPDLNTCDFCFWGYLKQLVSCDQTKTLPDLKDSISRLFLNISQNTLRSTVEHAILRFQIEAENDDHHVEHLLL
ncbi:transposable element tc3 transposase [Trichonephila clavipes]|nr:transposable element tc3 transposase [Trichonephila clavipes]